MDLEKTGSFIASLRKAHNMTQKDLAEKIGVTDKAVSRWETAKGFPDVSLLPKLAEVLDVTITELINGENTHLDEIEAQTDKALIEALMYSKSMSRKILALLTLIIGIILCLRPLFTLSLDELTILGAFISAKGIIMLSGGKQSVQRLKVSGRAAKIYSIAALVSALFLEFQQSGSVMIFSASPGYCIRKTFSYFSLLPVGYGNFFPFITGVLTAALLLASIIVLLKTNFVKMGNSVYICTLITFIISLGPVIFGREYISLNGIFISLLLFISAVLQAFANRKSPEI